MKPFALHVVIFTTTTVSVSWQDRWVLRGATRGPAWLGIGGKEPALSLGNRAQGK